MEKRLEIEQYIPFGEENAISRKRLAQITELNDRKLREAISRARRDTVILNLSNGQGYFRPIEGKEDDLVVRYFKQEESRLKRIGWSLLATRRRVKEIQNGKKNVILFNKVQVPHYNYVGDSILGYKSHMGAGSITSNVKSDKKLVVVKSENEAIETGLKKFGAMLGDNVEVGCGSVLNPGTVIGPNSNIYPLSSVRGIVPAGSIYKHAGEVVIKQVEE